MERIKTSIWTVPLDNQIVDMLVDIDMIVDMPFKIKVFQLTNEMEMIDLEWLYLDIKPRWEGSWWKKILPLWVVLWGERAMLNLYLIMPVDPAYEDLEIKRPKKSIK